MKNVTSKLLVSRPGKETTIDDMIPLNFDPLLCNAFLNVLLKYSKKYEDEWITFLKVTKCLEDVGKAIIREKVKNPAKLEEMMKKKEYVVSEERSTQPAISVNSSLPLQIELICLLPNHNLQLAFDKF